jgi:hypothetical protein
MALAEGRLSRMSTPVAGSFQPALSVSAEMAANHLRSTTRAQLRGVPSRAR